MAFCSDNISESQMVTSTCSHVQFLDIPDIINSTDAKCSFKISSPIMTVREGDKIGLFKVGWSDVKSCSLFVSLPTTALGTNQEDTITVSFDVEYADIHEEEFYQFCYVTASGAVRGVSRAFEIIDRTDDDDLVIINPSETGYTSFSSNGVSPQKWQQMLQGQKILELEEKLTTVMAERDHLIIHRDALDIQLLAECAEAAQLQATIEEIRVTLSKVEGKATDLSARLSDAEQARDAATKRVAELEEERIQLLMKSVELSEASKAETDAKLRESHKDLVAAVADGDRVKDTTAAHVQVVEKLSAELEQSKPNEHAAHVTVQNLQQQLEVARSETKTAKSEATGLKLVTEKQAAEISDLQQKVKDLELEGASSFALQSAIGTLKERLKKAQAERRVKEAELKNALTGSGRNAANKFIYDEDDKTRSFGFVSFEDHEAAQRAVEELNGKKVEGREMYVGRAQKKAKRLAELKDRLEREKQERITHYQGICLYVKNLGDDVDDEKLRTEFSQFGKITNAEVMTEGGRSKGFGFVCFSSPKEATNAVTEMNGRIMGSKPLYVALTQSKEDRTAQLAAQYMQRMQTIVVPQGQQAATIGQLYQPGGAGYFVPAGMQQRFYAAAPPQMQVRAIPRWASVRPGKHPGAAGFAAMQQAGGPRGMRQPTHPGAYMVRQPQQAAAGAGGAAAMSARPITGAPKTSGPPQRFAALPAVGGAAVPGGHTMAPTPAGIMFAPRQPQPFRFAANTRNPPLPVPAAGVIPPQMQQKQAAVMIQGRDPLTANTLAAAPAQEQKQMLGERLFPLIQGLYPDLAGKITGMLLEIDNAELLHMLESSDALRLKVEEAVAMLQAHQAKQKDLTVYNEHVSEQ